MQEYLGNQFSDIYDFTTNLTKKQKGDLFEEFTYWLFKLDPRLNANLKSIWLYPNIPDKILRELNLPPKDKGIDLLAKISGEYYAIQCKFRQNPNVTISWTELSTFFGLSFGLNNKIKGGFLVTNTFGLCDEVIKSTKVEPIYGDFFDGLPINFFESVRTGSTRITYAAKKPLLHQRECIINAIFHYLDFNRGFIEMACGSGKTLTSYWINKELFNKRTVIFVPSLYLLSQFYSDWINQSYADKHKINYLLIGSDADVGEEIKYKSNGLILELHPKKIRSHIKSIGCNEKLVVICTYQSSDKLAAASRGIDFDFAIYDEAHKTVGQCGKKFNLMLDNELMVIKKRLFMTATPKMYAGDIESDDIISMDNSAIYGEKFYTYNTGQAIGDKRLVDYQVVSIYAKNRDIRKVIRSNKLVKYKREFADLEANYLGIIILLLKKIHDGTCKHLVTYHNKIASAKKFAEILETINGILYDEELSMGHLSGSTSMAKRNRIIRDFSASDKAVLCSARVLNEGVNIPIIDSICFVDPRFSTIDIVQCIGRSLRLCEGKAIAHIIVPIFIENFDDDFDSSVYGNVIRILKALKTTDDGVVEYFKMKADGGVGNGSRQIVTEEYYDEVAYSEEIDLVEWNRNIGESVWQVTDTWGRMYEKVKKWVDENNKIPAPCNKPTNNENFLGNWCHKMRQNYKLKKLADNKVNLLNQIKHWYWNQNEIFDKKYAVLMLWINNNNTIPSSNAKNSHSKRLGVWCNSQRQKFKKNKLSTREIKKLEQIPCWYWIKEDKFDTNVGNLNKWIEENNKLPSRENSNELGKYLSRWCQRIKQKYHNNKLSNKCIKKLELIPGWHWKQPDNFTKIFNELQSWVNNNHKIPSYYAGNIIEKKLASWCSGQRQKYKKNKLDKDSIEKLTSINGWYWEKEKYDFDDKYAILLHWVEKNNKLPSSNCKNINERKLGIWCNQLRQKYKNKRLSEDEIKKLEKIKLFYFPALDGEKRIVKSFEQRCIELEKWMKHNNGKFPIETKKKTNENSIACWCTKQRIAKRYGKLPKKRIIRLQNITGWCWESNKKQYYGSKSSKDKKPLRRKPNREIIEV